MAMRFAAAKLVAALILVMFAAPLAAEAQPPGRVPRIGVLTVLPLLSITFPRQFPEALRDLGYIEKQNIILEWRSADGKADRLADLAAELVRVKVDVIVAITNPDILAAKQATTTIPIVLLNVADPVGVGLVASLARPGGNVTGVSSQAADFTAKLLELAKEVVPGLDRVAVITTPTNPALAPRVKDLEAAASGSRSTRLELGGRRRSSRRSRR
jgi:putative tryptophan/tyrosine transport system substrate-binding protein